MTTRRSQVTYTTTEWMKLATKKQEIHSILKEWKNNEGRKEEREGGMNGWRGRGKKQETVANRNYEKLLQECKNIITH